MEIAWIVMFTVTMLIPIHGAFYLGIRLERERLRKILHGLWKLNTRKR